MKILRVLYILVIAAMPSIAGADTFSDFCESFIEFYECNKDGRYTHEYHPYLLKKTARSFEQLESEIQKAGMRLAGRMVIMGYEGQAAPDYFTNLNHVKGARINDEVAAVTRAGVSRPQHNMFGLLTGFLLRQVRDFGASCNAIHHINPTWVRIFDQRAHVFQMDVFGQGYKLLLETEQAVLEAILQADTACLFDELIRFWLAIYRSTTQTGDKDTAGTQDILFTIEHARHMAQSSLPLLQFFTGADITYPINPTSRMSALATVNSQKFVTIFPPLLKPIEQQPTLYVFRSFVDGVGKSTMLGNVKNWMRFGDRVELYQAVDNSTSQLAEIFPVQKDVFIADLPAQLSHFTYKPDGVVFVDAASILSAPVVAKAQQFAEQQRDAMQEAFNASVQVIKGLVERDGWHAQGLDSPQNPMRTYIRNLLLLGKETDVTWIPFQYDGEWYLVDKTTLSSLRVARPLALAHAEGLKNIASEQMLFYGGVTFPLAYRGFLQDLIARSTALGIKQVVFIDFLSMYSRSSRENVRVNYLVQQLALLGRGFFQEKSFYRNIFDNAQLLHMLRDVRVRDVMTQAMIDETIIRFLLLGLIDQQQQATKLTALSLAQLTDHIKRFAQTELDAARITFLQDLAQKRVEQAHRQLERIHGMTKYFTNVLDQSLDDLVAFSDRLEMLFTHVIECPRINALWEGMGTEVIRSPHLPEGVVNEVVVMDNGTQMRARMVISPTSKNIGLLTELAHRLRANWQVVLSVLLETVAQPTGKLLLRQERWPVLPLVVKKGYDGRYYVLQRLCEQPNELPIQNIDSMFGIAHPESVPVGAINGCAYLFDLVPKNSYSGLYGFGYEVVLDYRRFTFPRIMHWIVSGFVKEYQEQSGAEYIMPTTILWESLRSDWYWQECIRKSIISSAVRYNQKPLAGLQTKFGHEGVMVDSIMLGHDLQRPGARLYAIALATMHMILHDPQGVVVVRHDSATDFVAALHIIEQIILPQYHSLCFERLLFDEHEEVAPLIGWPDPVSAT